MRKIEICPMEICDVPFVAEIEKENFSQNWSEKSFKSTLLDSNSYMITAKAEGKIIGYAGMYFVCDEGYMYSIAVHRDFRGKGVGTLLMENLILHCKQLNLKFLSLEVRESNQLAINLYKKLNFKKVGLRKNFYEKPRENAIIMTSNFIY